MSIPIHFLRPDSEEAREALSHALQNIPEGVPIVGLIVKVATTPTGKETLVNYCFTDPDTVRSLGLALAVSELDSKSSMEGFPND